MTTFDFDQDDDDDDQRDYTPGPLLHFHFVVYRDLTTEGDAPIIVGGQGYCIADGTTHIIKIDIHSCKPTLVCC